MRHPTLVLPILLIAAGAHAQAQEPWYQNSRQARAFVASLKPSQRDHARVLDTLNGVREGKLLDRYQLNDLSHLTRRAGLSDRRMRAALRLAFAHNRTVRMRTALQRYVRRGETVAPGCADPATSRLVALIEGSKFWRSGGRSDLARRAERQARGIARRHGVSIDEALALPVAYKKDVQQKRTPGSRSRAKGIVNFRRVMGEAARQQPVDATRPRGATRRVQSNPLWWTGFQTAYLDMLYRQLPEQLVARFKQDPRAGTFRIWHAGHEDGSQTFLLAAMVDEAVAALRKRRPEMRGFLDRLKVEIVATDLGQRLMRQGRRVQFRVEDGPVADKSPLVVEEIGRGEVRRARRAVGSLERRLGDGSAGAAGREKTLERLADSGKIGLLMRRFLGLTPEVEADSWRGGQPTYRIDNRSWKITDRENGGVLNRRVRDRVIRFELSDLTTSRPAGKMDLVVCTNVLPYLDLYSGVFRTDGHSRPPRMERTTAALRNIAASMRRGSTLVVDFRSEHTFRELASQNLAGVLGQMTAAGRKILVTRQDGVSPWRERPDPGESSW